MRSISNYVIGAVAGASMVALSLGTASAFTLSGPSLQQPVASAQIEKAWWRHGWGGGYYGGGWGWHHGWAGPGWGGGWGPGWGHRRWCYWHPGACY